MDEQILNVLRDFNSRVSIRQILAALGVVSNRSGSYSKHDQSKYDAVGRELLAHFRLIGGRSPIHIKDLILRPQVRFRIAVAIQAPLHVQRRSLENQRHLIDGAVTGGTSNTLINVNTVIEVDVIRKIVNAVPLQRRIGRHTQANGFEHRRIFPDL